MYIISVAPSFQKDFKRLDPELKDEAREKIALLSNPKNHQKLKAHKLHGRLKDRYGFSVTYKIRIVFNYLSRKEIILLAIDDHDVYR